MQGYCMKCRAKREVKNPKNIIMKNGRPATQGVCPVCGTKMFRIGKNGSPAAEKARMHDVPRMKSTMSYEPPGYEPPGYE